MELPKQKELSREIARLVERLPPLPGNVERLLAVGHDAATGQWLEVVAEDPSLCSELLYWTHACFGAERQAETIEDVSRCAGIESLVQLLAVSWADQALVREFSTQTTATLFAHSREISRICRILAQLTHAETNDRDRLTLSGLVHDVGRIVLLMAMRPETVALIGTTWDKMATIVQDEKTLLGLDHCDVGAQLCRKWNFAPFLQEGVLRHHSPLVNTDLSYPGAMVFVSHFVSGNDFTGDIIARLLPPELLERLGLSAALFDEARGLYARQEGTANAR